MTGVTFIKDGDGSPTHIILDLSEHGKAIQQLLEDITDAQTLQELTKGERDKKDYISIQEVRQELIKMGVPESDLMKVPNV